MLLENTKQWFKVLYIVRSLYKSSFVSISGSFLRELKCCFASIMHLLCLQVSNSFSQVLRFQKPFSSIRFRYFVRSYVSIQARRQDSVTGGGKNKFWGAREVYLCEFERGTRDLSQSGWNEQGEDQRFKGIFRPKSGIQAVFPPENRWSPKKRKKVFIPKMSWNPVSVHKIYENTGGKHQFGPRFALQ